MNNKHLITYQDNIAFINQISDKIINMNHHNKTILFIEPYGAALSLIKRGLELGYNIIICTANADLRIVPAYILSTVHLAVQLETTNETAIFTFVMRLRELISINAVIPGFEYFVTIAAKMNYYLDLPAMDISHFMQVRQKDLMRACLQQNDIAIPKFQPINSIDDLNNAMVAIGFPAVIKPVDAAGSVYVKKVSNHKEALEAATRILTNNTMLWGHHLTKSALYEEFIDGKEYSIEGVVINKKISYFSHTEKFVSDQLEFVEIGHIVNVPVDCDLKEKSQKYIEKIIYALGINNCPFHAEFRMNVNNEPVLMEIAARLAGDKIADLINLSSSVNYFDYVYASYFGEDLPVANESKYCAGIRFFYRPNIDRFTMINKLDQLNTHQIYESIFYYKPNEYIPAFPKPLRRLGHVIMKNQDYQFLKYSLEQIDSTLEFM